MKYNPDIHHRRSIRLKNYDYSQSGAYFITICTFQRENLFGEILKGEMQLNPFGEIARNEWLKTAEMRPAVTLGEWILMPNHLHGIVEITGNRRGTLPRALGEGVGDDDTRKNKTGTQQQGHVQRAPTERFGKPVSNSIPTIVRMFKAVTTKRINEMRKLPNAPVWQKNYYEHVIRSEKSLHQIREYIANNPFRWEFDRENPAGSLDDAEKDFWEKVGV